MNNLYIKCLKSEKNESGSMYGQFLINSLQPGQGITVGNLLRRVLLSDLGGTTITAVRIAGVKDEFSIIPGVREDILEILLNLKGIVFKNLEKNFSVICMSSYFSFWPKSWSATEILDMPIVSEQVYVH